MIQRETVGGEISCLSVPIWVHDERLGLIYRREIELYNIPIDGWNEYTPATYMEPPMVDGEVTIELTPEELWDLLEESDDGMLREDNLTLIETPQSFFDGAVEAAADKVWDNPDTYLREFDED